MALIAPPRFDYERPGSVGRACERLGSVEGAVPLAGGTDIVPMRAKGTIAPPLLVDIKELDELQGIQTGADGSTTVGSCVTMAELAARDEPILGALADGATVVGGPMTRNRATVGGNVCRSSPAGDTLPALIVLGAHARIHSGAGDRLMAMEDFFTGAGTNALEPGELLGAIELPGVPGGSAYQRLTYRAWLDLAVVGVAARVSLEAGRCVDAAVALGGVAPRPIPVPAAAEALVGSELGMTEIADAASACVDAADPIDDVRGSREYRLHGLGVLARRVIAAAVERGREFPKGGGPR